ncbi:unnamed protein product [Trichobilharzia szidati]|nr:unnamed protein product [Trichobilharzia szidati]
MHTFSEKYDCYHHICKDTISTKSDSHADENDPRRINEIMSKAIQDMDWIVKKYSTTHSHIVSIFSFTLFANALQENAEPYATTTHLMCIRTYILVCSQFLDT